MDDFSITALWGPRPEEPCEIASRIRSLLAELRPITPSFQRWYQLVTEDNMPELDEAETWLDSVVASDVCKGDLGEPIPQLGYLSQTTNDPVVYSKRSDEITIFTHAGGSGEFNSVTLSSANGQTLPPSIVDYSVVKQTILAVSHAFEPSWCEAGPYSLCRSMVMSRYKKPPVITPCWMIHLSPPLARRIAPPPGIIGERYDDGSLFMSVTDQTFDPHNSMHVENAHRLFAVLDTLQEKLPREQWRR